MSRHGKRGAPGGSVSRRTFLRTIALGAGATALTACQPQTPTAAPQAVPPPAAPPAAQPGWQQAWDALVEAARREGQLVLHAPPTAETRQRLPAAFKDRFGITVEYVAVRSSELAPKIVAEKQAGLVSIDVAITGMSSWVDVLYPAGLVADMKPLLILPEVIDASLWVADPPLFVDPEQKKLMRLFNSASAMVAVNRDHVDPASLRTAQDLLRPELRQRIISDDPLVAGPGGLAATYFLEMFGEDFVRKLYGEQVVSNRDPRQRADGVGRGVFPVWVGAEAAPIQTLLDDGFHIEIVRLQDAPGYTSAAFGISGIIEGAPHPKAAQLFANWLASREGLEIYSRAEREVGMRKDLNYAEWVPEFTIPKPGVKYIDTYTWDFKSRVQPAAQEKLRELLRTG